MSRHRAFALLLVAPFLAYASTLAPQHIHEPGADHDHNHAVAHSHFGPHEFESHHDTGTEIEHGDAEGEHVVWLDGSILHQSPYRALRLLPVVPASDDIAPEHAGWSATSSDDAALAHGPPQTVDFVRGPPSLRLS